MTEVNVDRREAQFCDRVTEDAFAGQDREKKVFAVEFNRYVLIPQSVTKDRRFANDKLRFRGASERYPAAVLRRSTCDKRSALIGP